MPRPSDPALPMPAASADRSRPVARERGQAMVEFAAVLLPILLIVVAIIQFGLILGANVTLTNAAREGARAATIARYSVEDSRAVNDLDRCTAALDAARQSFGIMTAASPNFVVTRPCPAGSATDLNGDGLHDQWVNGDLTVTLCASMATPTSPCPTTGTYCTADDPVGCLVQITLVYRSDIIVPLIGGLLPTDGSGRFVQRSVATMVVN
jgi:Flp pilus assembly protein TadG